jgi:hypothetical protein
MCIVKASVELPFAARQLSLRHAEGGAPESGGGREIIRPTIDDESSQFAFMHRFLQICADT